METDDIELSICWEETIKSLRKKIDNLAQELSALNLRKAKSMNEILNYFR